ncbi:MAG TPA: VOC family protein [Vicinamibacterales bacterium]|nr:VOC family protein [Vicinamibacterales bacterium]
MPARLALAIPILDVRDVEAALRYYVERLGFEIDFRYENDPGNYAGVRRDDVSLHMQWQHDDHFKKGTAGQLRFRIQVDDPDSLCDEYRRRGALDQRVEVRDTEWGTREFGFRDPDGNGLIFFRDG